LKRLLVLSFALTLVLGLTLVASAGEIELSGDTRVRGIWQENFDYDESTKDDENWYDYRFRFNVTGKVRDIEARSRITLLESKFSEKMSGLLTRLLRLMSPGMMISKTKTSMVDLSMGSSAALILA
jgi:DNA primase large subunit